MMTRYGGDGDDYHLKFEVISRLYIKRRLRKLRVNRPNLLRSSRKHIPNSNIRLMLIAHLHSVVLFVCTISILNIN